MIKHNKARLPLVWGFIPFLTGSKTPTSRFERNKEDKWEITARKDRDERLTLKDQARHKEVAY
jgi:hypothetical protein